MLNEFLNGNIFINEFYKIKIYVTFINKNILNNRMEFIMKDYETIYNTFYNRTYFFLLKLTHGNKELCDDLTQETFFQVFKSLTKYNEKSELYTWICSIAKHTYYSYLRKNKKDQVFDVYLENIRDFKTSSTEDIVSRNITRQKIIDYINKLPYLKKTVVIMRLYDETSYAEIAEKLNISENSAKVIYFRTKIEIKEKFKNEN